MATIKKPLRIGDETPESNFQAGEVIGPEHGGTGKDLTDLSGQAGKYTKVNATEDGFEFDTPAGGATDLTFTGSSSPFTLNSSTGTDVTIAAGANITLSRSGNELTIAAAGGGGGGVASVTGPGVDNTDAANPVVNARPYKVYAVLLDQAGTSDPTVELMENTTGATISWGRVDAGEYVATASSSVFTNKKTMVFFTPGSETAPRLFSCISETEDTVKIRVWNLSETQTDELTRASVEIRVYP